MSVSPSTQHVSVFLSMLKARNRVAIPRLRYMPVPMSVSAPRLRPALVSRQKSETQIFMSRRLGGVDPSLARPARRT